MVGKHPLQPRQDTRLRIMNAAWEAFREKGYRVSLETVAAHAGVARQTLYNHFPGKKLLFGEVVRHATRSILVTLEGGGPLRATLVAFGRALRERVLSPDGIAVYRTLVAEAATFPDLADHFFAEGPVATRQRLAHVLSEAMKQGMLRRADPAFAAEMLIAMLIEFDRLRCLLARGGQAGGKDKTERVVDCFLRAFAPEAPPKKKENP
ncbi:MAG: TetR/AcrR family transcriptional regulator [Desulfobacterales bacterium]